jgi:phosphoribosylformylglycinamidine (FGAM) synthase PurS component
MKVRDRGSYTLLDPQMQTIAKIEQDYVPHGVIPGSYGDYIELDIDANGKIRNWPKSFDLHEFFRED